MSHGVQVGVSQVREGGPGPAASTCWSSWLQFADHWHLSSCVPVNRSHRKDLGHGPAQALDLRGSEAVEGTPDCQTRRREAIGSSRRVPLAAGDGSLLRACGSETAAAMAGQSPIGVSCDWGGLCVWASMIFTRASIFRNPGSQVSSEPLSPWALGHSLSLLVAHPSTWSVRLGEQQGQASSILQVAMWLLNSRLLRTRKAISDTAIRRQGPLDVQQHPWKTVGQQGLGSWDGN